MFDFSIKSLDLKAGKVKTGIKLKVLLPISYSFGWKSYFFNNWIAFEIKMLSILNIASEFVSFDLLQVAIRSFSNDRHICAPAIKKDLVLKKV